MTTLYRSRQVSWVPTAMVMMILVVAAVLSVGDQDDGAPWWFFAIVGLALIPFSVMNLTVNREHLRIVFLLGVPRCTVPIPDIVTCEIYEASGLQRLNFGVKPMQGRFQMSGSSGVLIARRRGVPITLSDPDPKKLSRAVAKARERHAQIHGVD